VSAASQPQSIDGRFATSDERIDVIELEKPALVAPLPACAHEGASALIAFPHSPSNVGGDMAFPEWFA
jgi:hypothetical protein